MMQCIKGEMAKDIVLDHIIFRSERFLLDMCFTLSKHSNPYSLDPQYRI